MDSLDDIFDRHLNRLPYTILELILNKKLEDQNITIPKDELSCLAEYILEHKQCSHIKITETENHHPCITITDDDVQIIQKTCDNFLNNLDEFVDGMTEEMSEMLLQPTLDSWSTIANSEHDIIFKFRDSLLLIWGKAISLLRLHLKISFDIAMRVQHKSQNSETPYLYDALFRLHAKACQVTEEVIVLLSAGLADGALARWRTLHEIAITSLVISDHGEDLAERYILHEAIESKKAIDDFNNHHDALGVHPIPPEEIEYATETYNSLVLRYGTSYKNQYGWASEATQNNNPKFVHIEALVDLSHYRPLYKLASHSIHANPKGLFFRLGILEEENLLLAGPSDVGLAEPGHNTASSLLLATTALATTASTIDSLTLIKLMNTLHKLVCEEFLKAQEAQHNKDDVDPRGIA